MREIFEEDVGEFLEHHGVKGMRWGVRVNNRPAHTGTITFKAKKPKKHDTLTGLKPKTEWKIGAGVAVGAVAVAGILKAIGSKKLRLESSSYSRKGLKFVAQQGWRLGGR